MNFDYTEGKVLIKGVITDIQAKTGIPSAAIVLFNNKKGIVADANGNFSMYVYPNDTLKVSSIGYLPKILFIQDIAEKDRYSIKVELVQDFYQLKEIKIYPFKNKDEFAKAFIKGEGVNQPITIYGVAAPKYIHKEKSKISNPVSLIYDKIKASRRAADPDFKP